jgi:hypothetical protein
VAARYTSFLGAIPSGKPGVRATLEIMVYITRKTRATLPVRIPAQQWVQGCREKDWLCEAQTLHAIVRDRIRYVRDVHNVETVQFPEQTLQLASGDCDDKTVLLGSLAAAIGFPVRFVAVAVNNEMYSHVLPQLLIPRYGWITAETIPIDSDGNKAELGWFPPDGTCVMFAHV